MNSAGYLQIALGAGGKPHNVSISWSASQNPNRLFRGRPLAEALQTVPLLFNICRRAQAVAAVSAAEQALRHAASESVQRGRLALVTLEMLHEHLWSLLLDLPPLLGLPARQREMAAASQQLTALMGELDSDACLTQFANRQPVNPDLHARPGNALRNELRGLLFGDDNAPLGSLAELHAGSGLAATMLRRIAALDWQTGWQIQRLPPLHDIQAMQLATQHPPHQGLLARTAETGVLPRLGQHPLVEESRRSGGNGLSTRFVALLLETNQMLNGNISTSIQQQRLKPNGNKAVSCVETARGRLVHWLSLAGTTGLPPIVDSMHMLSPTDWNFHPQGVAARLLGELASTGYKQLETRARLLIKLLNPCVAYQLHVAHQAAPHETCHA